MRQAPRQQNVGRGLGAQQVPSVGQRTHAKHLGTAAGRRHSTAEHHVPPRHVVAEGTGIALCPHHPTLHLFKIQLSQPFFQGLRLYPPVLYLLGALTATSWQVTGAQPHHAAPGKCPRSCPFSTCSSSAPPGADSSRWGCVSPHFKGVQHGQNYFPPFHAEPQLPAVITTTAPITPAAVFSFKGICFLLLTTAPARARRT